MISLRSLCRMKLWTNVTTIANHSENTELNLASIWEREREKGILNRVLASSRGRCDRGNELKDRRGVRSCWRSRRYGPSALLWRIHRPGEGGTKRRRRRRWARRRCCCSVARGLGSSETWPSCNGRRCLRLREDEAWTSIRYSKTKPWPTNLGV